MSDEGGQMGPDRGPVIGRVRRLCGNVVQVKPASWLGTGDLLARGASVGFAVFVR